jgi:hypothetical protein
MRQRLLTARRIIGTTGFAPAFARRYRVRLAADTRIATSHPVTDFREPRAGPTQDGKGWTTADHLS